MQAVGRPDRRDRKAVMKGGRFRYLERCIRHQPGDPVGMQADLTLLAWPVPSQLTGMHNIEHLGEQQRRGKQHRQDATYGCFQTGGMTSHVPTVHAHTRRRNQGHTRGHQDCGVQSLDGQPASHPSAITKPMPTARRQPCNTVSRRPAGAVIRGRTSAAAR